MYYYSIGRDLPQSLIRLCYCAPMHIYTHLCVDHICILIYTLRTNRITPTSVRESGITIEVSL